jgi:general secretion pathway protein D
MLLGFKTIGPVPIQPLAFCLLLLSLTAFASPARRQCEVGDQHCTPAAQPPSKGDIKNAKKEFEQAQKLQKKDEWPDALGHLDRAVELNPLSTDYASARELLRQQIVTNHIDRGNEMLRSNKTVEATAEFRSALSLDPHNQYALQRLQDATPLDASLKADQLTPTLTVVADSKPVVIAPQPGVRDFHLKGSSRNVLEQIAAAYGVKLIFDDSVSSKSIKFDIEAADFFGAFREVAKIAHIFWVPLTPKQLILFNDTQALRREYERLESATFYLNDASSAQELNDVVNMLRTLFDVRFAVAQPSNYSVAVRAPVPILEAATKVLQNFLTRRPQVIIEVQVFEVSSQLTRAMGLSIPNEIQVINVGAAALALLGTTNTQDLINQLIASGGINQANSTALQTLLSQLQNQQSSNSSLSALTQNPFASFGGGKSFFAVPIPPITATFQYSQSDVKSLERISLRASQGNAATLRIGSRYPILNASFAPIFNSSAISSAISNGSYQAPIPSFTYEDLGITLKATPQVLADSNINLKLEMQIRSLTGQSVNGVPVLSNRDYTATMSVLDGSSTAVVGMISKTEQKSLSGFPGLNLIPVLGAITSSHNVTEDQDELLIVVTPTIVSPARGMGDGSEVWVPTT